MTRLAMVSALLAWILVAGSGPSLSQQPATCTPHDELGLGPAGGGSVALIFDVGGLVTRLEFGVPNSALRPWVKGQIALDITITSQNGVFHQHGAGVVPLSASTFIISIGNQSRISIPWEYDTIPRVNGDLYLVTSKLIDVSSGAPLGVTRFVEYQQ